MALSFLLLTERLPAEHAALPVRGTAPRASSHATQPTYLNDASSDFCDPFGFCQAWLHQFELTGGVVFRF